MIIDFIKRMFSKTNWKIAVREISNENSCVLSIERKKEYNSLIFDGDYWCADPFLCYEDGKLYMFCECFLNEKSKGVIAVGEYKNCRIDEIKIVLEQDYHMSYPCVFKYNSNFYMLPETSDNNTIELYQAKNFPYDWELIKTLKNDIKCVDLTVVRKDKKYYAIGYKLDNKKNEICVFQLDMEDKTLTLIDQVKDDNTGRPAGNIFCFEDKLIRPTQISKKKYGESIVFREIVSMSKGAYCEKAHSQIKGKDILVKGEKSIDRVHTINRTKNIEIIDYSHDSFDLIKPVSLLIYKLKKITN